eukprot:403355332
MFHQVNILLKIGTYRYKTDCSPKENLKVALKFEQYNIPNSLQQVLPELYRSHTLTNNGVDLIVQTKSEIAEMLSEHEKLQNGTNLTLILQPKDEIEYFTSTIVKQQDQDLKVDHQEDAMLPQQSEALRNSSLIAKKIKVEDNESLPNSVPINQMNSVNFSEFNQNFYYTEQKDCEIYNQASNSPKISKMQKNSSDQKIYKASTSPKSILKKRQICDEPQFKPQLQATKNKRQITSQKALMISDSSKVPMISGKKGKSHKETTEERRDLFNSEMKLSQPLQESIQLKLKQDLEQQALMEFELDEENDADSDYDNMLPDQFYQDILIGQQKKTMKIRDQQLNQNASGLFEDDKDFFDDQDGDYQEDQIHQDQMTFENDIQKATKKSAKSQNQATQNKQKKSLPKSNASKKKKREVAAPDDQEVVKGKLLKNGEQCFYIQFEDKFIESLKDKVFKTFRELSEQVLDPLNQYHLQKYGMKSVFKLTFGKEYITLKCTICGRMKLWFVFEKKAQDQGSGQSKYKNIVYFRQLYKFHRGVNYH